MVGHYRLSEFGFDLPAGAHIVAPETVRAVEGATALIEAAEAKAAGIIKDAEQAYQDERERGYRDGLAKARLESFERLVGESATLDAELHRVEGELSRLVLACVRKLVDGFDDRAKAEATVRSALKQMRREKRAELRVAPSQYGHFNEAIGAITAQFPEVELIDVVEDAGLEAPRVIIETGIGRVDGDLGGNIAELEAILRRVVAGEEESAPLPEAATP
jgi:type III secretion protein L